MTDTYTFRYLNADGSFFGMTVIQIKDRHAAAISAARLMPKKAASLEIWLGDVLISKECKPRPVLSESIPQRLEERKDMLWWRPFSMPTSSY